MANSGPADPEYAKGETLKPTIGIDDIKLLS